MRAAGQTREKKDQEMATLITESNNAYSERDRRKMDIVHLKIAESTDVRAFEEKLTVLNQTIEAQKVASVYRASGRPSDLVPDSGALSQPDQHDDLTAVTDQLQMNIQVCLDLCKVKDVQELFEEAQNLERENFSLYNYVVEHAAARLELQEEINSLELQKKALNERADSDEVEQSQVLEKLAAEIQRVGTDLDQIWAQKEANESEFESLYTKIGMVFNELGCSWENTPDGKTLTTPSNVLHCLSLIETSIAGMMNTTYEKTKLECAARDIKISAFVSDEQAQKHPATSSASGRPGPEKELAGKITEANRPLSLEEVRGMLEPME
jgi:hypothetical protein